MATFKDLSKLFSVKFSRTIQNLKVYADEFFKISELVVRSIRRHTAEEECAEVCSVKGDSVEAIKCAKNAQR